MTPTKNTPVPIDVKQLPGYFYRKDLNGVYLSCNQNMADLLNQAAGIKLTLSNHASVMSLPAIFQQDEHDVIANEKRIISEYEIVFSHKKESCWLQLERSPLYENAEQENSPLIGLQTVGIDITHLKNQHLSWQKEETIYNLEYIVDHMPGYIYWKDQQSRYMGCNHNLVTISGLSNRDELIGKTDFDFFWGRENASQFVADDQAVMHNRLTQSTEYQLAIVRHDGKALMIRTDKMPLVNKYNEVIGILAIAVDITDQKILEESLIKEKEHVQLLSQAKTEFMRNMEHDIRTPFSGIYTLAESMYQQEHDAEKKDYLQMITQSAKELLDYCNNIVDFSRLESGVLPIIHKKFNIHTLLENLIKVEQPAAQTKGLVLSLVMDPAMPAILLGDPYRLQRILMNLTGNALKFTAKGTITVSTQLMKQDEKSLIVRIMVEDTGIGIAADKIDFIYERFARLTPSNQGMYKGSGLGLTIVKQLIEELGAEIDVKSSEHIGTTFTCTLAFKQPLIAEIIS